MATVRDGSRTWSATRDAEGHREYRIKHLVDLEDGEGPKAAFDAPGLPQPGDTWQVDSDSDQYATCLPTATIAPHMTKDGERIRFVLVEQVYSTKPPDPAKGRCNDTPVEDPLLEPQKLSGSFTRYQEEATQDRFGLPIRTSSHEIVRGQQVEFDKNRATYKVEQNVALLGQELYGPMIDTVNDRPLWGYPARCVKLSTPSWDRKFYQRCRIYFTRTFTFEANVTIDPATGVLSSGWDKDLLDEGSKVLNGHWGVATRSEVEGAWYVDLLNGLPADPRKPEHFIQAKDKRGENIRMVLNGSGLPAGIVVVDTPITLVAVVALTNNLNPPIIAQPINACRLQVKIVNANSSISQGWIVLTGTDVHDVVVTENIDISDAGSIDYITQGTYKTLTQVLVGGPQVPLVGVGGGDTVQIVTDTSKLLEGRVHVEKYTESNFFLLGIPINFLN